MFNGYCTKKRKIICSYRLKCLQTQKRAIKVNKYFFYETCVVLNDKNLHSTKVVRFMLMVTGKPEAETNFLHPLNLHSCEKI